jgi:hypothetical protein
MKNNKQLFGITIILALSLFFCPAAFAKETSIDLEIDFVKHMRAPEFYGNRVILTYEDERPVKSVAAIFDHEGYTKLHLYEKNKNDIFCLIYPVPASVSELKYRIVVDGLITDDPSNSDIETNVFGISFSRVEIPDNFIKPRIFNPELSKDGMIKLTYTALPGRIVSLLGDFNMWDPYANTFEEDSNGVYTIRLRVAPGRHYYYFFVNGEKRLDPNNLKRMVSDYGEEVNSFVVPN